MYTIHDVVLGTHASTPVVVGNITSLNHSTNHTIVAGYASGTVSAKAQYIGESPHSTTLTTTALEILLGLNTATFLSAGLCVNTANSIFAFREHVGCNSGVASNQAVSVANLFTYITSISAQIGQSVTADLECRHLSSDGITSPVVVVTGASLTAAALLPEFILAEAYIDGVLIDQVTGITINTGIELQEQKQGAGIFVTDVFVKTANPTSEITTQDFAKANALLNGATASTGVDIYFAKRKSGAITELYTATEHVKIASTAGGVKHLTTMQASRDDASGVIKIELVLPAAGTQSCLIASTGIAIS